MVLIVLLVAVVAATSPRAAAARKQHDEGLDGHGHGTAPAPPYWKKMGYKLNANGTITYHYRYREDPDGTRHFLPRAYDDLIVLSGCSVPKEMLVDLTDIYMDRNKNHLFEKCELQRLLDCLPKIDYALAKTFNIVPAEMMVKCDIDGVPGISSSDYIMSEHCLPKCMERQMAFSHIFKRLIDRKCAINDSLTYDPREIFGKEWKEYVGGPESFDEWCIVWKDDL